MSQNMTRDEEQINEILDNHDSVEHYTYESPLRGDVFVTFEGDTLASRSFLDDLQEHGVVVEFVDFATNRIGFSYEQ